MTEDTEKLAACPFCGGEPTAYEGKFCSSVKCDNGHAIHEYKPTLAEAIAAWNTRSTPPTPPDDGLVERLRTKADVAGSEGDVLERNLFAQAADAIEALSRLTTTDRPEQVREAAAKAADRVFQQHDGHKDLSCEVQAAIRAMPLPPSPKTTPNDGLRELLALIEEASAWHWNPGVFENVREPLFYDRDDLWQRIDGLRAALSSTAHDATGAG